MIFGSVRSSGSQSQVNFGSVPGQSHGSLRSLLVLSELTSSVRRNLRYFVLFFTEPVDGAVLHQAEVVLSEAGDEDDGAHVLKAVDPLAALRPLAPNIHQPELDLAKLKHSLLDIRTLHYITLK